MADITVHGSLTIGRTIRGLRKQVWTSATVGYHLFGDAGTGDLVYVKTTDGGATWTGTPVVIATEVTLAYDVWFDQWTSGDSGTKIHLVYFGTTADDVFYRSLDTSSDTLGTEVTIFAGATAVAGRSNFASVTKARGGNLYCAFDIDAGAELGFYRSTDAGASWTSRDATFVEAQNDIALLFPGNEADNQDIWALYHDASADELTLKVHDDSAGTTSESAAILTMVEGIIDGTMQFGFSGSLLSNGHLFVVAVSDFIAVGADMRCFDINGTGSITEKTALTTNIQQCYYPQVYIDDSDKIYVSYLGKRDGTETLETTAGVYYATSTDSGGTWSAGDTTYSATASDWRSTFAPIAGPMFFVSWLDISANALMGNSDNAVAYSAGAAQRFNHGLLLGVN